jgi:hypothetical protein
MSLLVGFSSSPLWHDSGSEPFEQGYVSIVVGKMKSKSYRRVQKQLWILIALLLSEKTLTVSTHLKSDDRTSIHTLKSRSI